MAVPDRAGCSAIRSSRSTICGGLPRCAMARRDEARLAASAFSSGCREPVTSTGQSRPAFLGKRPGCPEEALRQVGIAVGKKSFGPMPDPLLA